MIIDGPLLSRTPFSEIPDGVGRARLGLLLALAFRAPASAHGTVVYSRRKVRKNMDMALVQRIEELGRLSVAALKEKYREVLGVETRSSHKQYLLRRIAWQLQAQEEGGLVDRAVDRAVQIADDADLRSVGPKGFWSCQNRHRRYCLARTLERIAMRGFLSRAGSKPVAIRVARSS